MYFYQKKYKHEYALYRGDECLETGTLKEIAEKRNIKTSTLRFYQTPTYKKRGKNQNKRLELIRIDGDDF